MLGLANGCALDNLLGNVISGWRAARWERLKVKEELSFKLAAQEKAPSAPVGERPRRAIAHGAGASARQRAKRLSTSSTPARLNGMRRRRPHDYDAIMIIS